MASGYDSEEEFERPLQPLARDMEVGAPLSSSKTQGTQGKRYSQRVYTRTNKLNL